MKEKSKSIFNTISSLVIFFPVAFSACLICGFLIWNTFLFRLGFEEYKIIQTKFILSGFCFLLLLSFFFWIVIAFVNTFTKDKKYEKTCRKLASFVTKQCKNNLFVAVPTFFIFFAVIIVGYTTIIFPKIPSDLGGGYPRFLSIITTENEIAYLSPLGISAGEGSKIQTGNLCVAYENEEIVIILLKDRIVSLRKDIIKDFGSLSAGYTKMDGADYCGALAKNWLLSSNYFKRSVK